VLSREKGHEDSVPRDPLSLRTLSLARGLYAELVLSRGAGGSRPTGDG